MTLRLTGKDDDMSRDEIASRIRAAVAEVNKLSEYAARQSLNVWIDSNMHTVAHDDGSMSYYPSSSVSVSREMP